LTQLYGRYHVPQNVGLFIVVCCDFVECRENQRQCHNSSRCVPARLFCDGYNDCGDWSDELNSGDISTYLTIILG